MPYGHVIHIWQMFVVKRPQVSSSDTSPPHLAMAPRPSDSAILKSLSYRVSEIFDQAQSSAANHRKNCITLHKLHARAASITQTVDNGHSIIAGEHCFGGAFLDMVNRILIVKKGPAVADRIVKFIGGYVKYMNEKGVLSQTV
jgi:condensin complex subunit 3